MNFANPTGKNQYQKHGGGTISRADAAAKMFGKGSKKHKQAIAMDKPKKKTTKKKSSKIDPAKVAEGRRLVNAGKVRAVGPRT